MPSRGRTPRHRGRAAGAAPTRRAGLAGLARPLTTTRRSPRAMVAAWVRPLRTHHETPYRTLADTSPTIARTSTSSKRGTGRVGELSTSPWSSPRYRQPTGDAHSTRPSVVARRRRHSLFWTTARSIAFCRVTVKSTPRSLSTAWPSTDSSDNHRRTSRSATSARRKRQEPSGYPSS